MYFLIDIGIVIISFCVLWFVRIVVGAFLPF